ncbi:hypothetical protein BST61_g6062 [Cercospora zeina]
MFGPEASFSDPQSENTLFTYEQSFISTRKIKPVHIQVQRQGPVYSSGHRASAIASIRPCGLLAPAAHSLQPSWNP